MKNRYEQEIARIHQDASNREKIAEERFRLEEQKIVKQMDEKSSLKLVCMENKFHNDISLIEDKHRKEIL